ncbi:MAG: hypothetical protein HGA49_07570 [Eubacteriaceae bacterium]|nr:hypothetical protein [Eubacteriaceae bacterium]
MDSKLNFENADVKKRYDELAEIYAIHHVNWNEGVTITHEALNEVETLLKEIYDEKKKSLA